MPALRTHGHHQSAGLQEPLRELRHRLPPRRLLRLIPPAAPTLRPEATLAVLDVTKYYGDTTGGVRTYLNEKSAYVAARPSLRHVLVVPGAVDAMEDGAGTRTYRLAGPPIPTQPPYRFPQFTDRQRLNPLIRCHKATEHVGIETTVGVGNERPGDSIDPWVILQVARPKFGQLPVIPRR